MNVKFVHYDRDYAKYKDEYDAVWFKINSEGNLILRQETEDFEKQLAEYVGTKYAVALSSGTAAIYLALKALGVKGGVALPSHTFKSTCGATIDAGCTPIVYDMDGVVDKLAEAHIPVHIAGELSPIADLGIPVIEDACQAFGALRNPTSNVQCWSFYPAKVLGGKMDGGAITTNDEKVYNYIKEARNHFKTDNEEFGGNFRMSNLCAGLLSVKLKHIDEILARRHEIARKYFVGLPYKILPQHSAGRQWQDFIINVGDKRDELYSFLRVTGVETMKNEYPFTPEYPKLPLAAKYEAETLRIPCNETLEDSEVSEVINKINEFFK